MEGYPVAVTELVSTERTEASALALDAACLFRIPAKINETRSREAAATSL